MSALHSQLVRSSEAERCGSEARPAVIARGQVEDAAEGNRVVARRQREQVDPVTVGDRLAGPRATGDPEDVVRGVLEAIERRRRPVARELMEWLPVHRHPERGGDDVVRPAPRTIAQLLLRGTEEGRRLYGRALHVGDGEEDRLPGRNGTRDSVGGDEVRGEVEDLSRLPLRAEVPRGVESRVHRHRGGDGKEPLEPLRAPT